VLGSTVLLLYRAHLVHRAARAEEIDRYFSEQWTYRQSILSMHAAALAAGITMSNAGSDGTLVDKLRLRNSFS
jgi:hypothetical protein